MRKSGRHFWAIWGNFGPFGLIFGPFCVIFGPFWVIFGPFWVLLGHFWAILWHFWTNLQKVQFFCGIVGVAILAFRIYEEDEKEKLQNFTKPEIVHGSWVASFSPSDWVRWRLRSKIGGLVGTEPARCRNNPTSCDATWNGSKFRIQERCILIEEGIFFFFKTLNVFFYITTNKLGVNE